MIKIYFKPRQSGKTTSIIKNALSCEENNVYIFTQRIPMAKEIHYIINRYNIDNAEIIKNDKIVNVCTYNELIGLNSEISGLNRKIYWQIMQKEKIKFFFDDFYSESDGIINEVSNIFENISCYSDDKLNIEIFSSLDKTKRIFKGSISDYFIKNADLIYNFYDNTWKKIDSDVISYLKKLSIL